MFERLQVFNCRKMKHYFKLSRLFSDLDNSNIQILETSLHVQMNT